MHFLNLQRFGVSGKGFIVKLLNGLLVAIKYYALPQGMLDRQGARQTHAGWQVFNCDGEGRCVKQIGSGQPCGRVGVLVEETGHLSSRLAQANLVDEWAAWWRNALSTRDSERAEADAQKLHNWRAQREGVGHFGANTAEFLEGPQSNARKPAGIQLRRRRPSRLR